MLDLTKFYNHLSQIFKVFCPLSVIVSIYTHLLVLFSGKPWLIHLACLQLCRPDISPPAPAVSADCPQSHIVAGSCDFVEKKKGGRSWMATASPSLRLHDLFVPLELTSTHLWEEWWGAGGRGGRERGVFAIRWHCIWDSGREKQHRSPGATQTTCQGPAHLSAPHPSTLTSIYGAPTVTQLVWNKGREY